MGYIRSPKIKGGRYQAEARLKGHPTLTRTFDRKHDARDWIQKTEADIRRGLGGLLVKRKLCTFAEAVDRYFKEQTVSEVKRGHLLWWKAELGPLFIQKEWDANRGCWSCSPRHDWASHGSDAFSTLTTGLPLFTRQVDGRSLAAKTNYGDEGTQFFARMRSSF